MHFNSDYTIKDIFLNFEMTKYSLERSFQKE